jgi:Glycosyl transferases group 1
LAGSVPVINFPTIQRFAPLIHGVHCFYYAVEGDDLFQIIRAALTAKYRLKEMAAAAREHVLTHHTPNRVGDYILAESMSVRSLDLSRRSPALARTSGLSYRSASVEEVEL